MAASRLENLSTYSLSQHHLLSVVRWRSFEDGEIFTILACAKDILGNVYLVVLYLGII